MEPKFKIGDYVKVVDLGQSCPHYPYLFQKMKFNTLALEPREDGNFLNRVKVGCGRIFAIETGLPGDVYYGIENGTKQMLIGEEGLELVEGEPSIQIGQEHIQDMKQELKPCPFCGEQPIISEKTLSVFCKNADCPEVIAGESDNIEDAIEGWNTRVAGNKRVVYDTVGYMRIENEECPPLSNPECSASSASITIPEWQQPHVTTLPHITPLPRVATPIINWEQRKWDLASELYNRVNAEIYSLSYNVKATEFSFESAATRAESCIKVAEIFIDKYKEINNEK